MGLLDGPLRSVGASLLGQFGQTVVLILASDEDEEYDPTTGEVVASTPREIAVRATIGQYKARYGEEAGGAVRRGDLDLTVPAQGLDDVTGFRAPRAGDRVVIGAMVSGETTAPLYTGGEEYGVVHVDPTVSGDQAAVYLVHVRR